MRDARRASGRNELLSLSREYGTPLPFIDHLGIERVTDPTGRALLELEIGPEHRNSWKAAHGGVIGGRSTLFCEAEVRDDDGKLVAKGMGTLRPVRKKEA